MVVMSSEPSYQESQKIIDALMTQKLDLIRDLIRQYNIAHKEQLSYTGTLSELQDKISQYVSSGKLSQNTLLEWLHTLEGWRSQHIYLYEVQGNFASRWRTEVTARTLLNEHFGNCDEVFNFKRYLVPPTVEPEISCIEWSVDRLRITWINENFATKRNETYDNPRLDTRIALNDGTVIDVVYRAYERTKLRRVIAFEWHFDSQTAMIQITSSNLRDHDEVREHLETQHLNLLFGQGIFERVVLANSIHNLRDSGLVGTHHAIGLTPNASTISIRGVGKDSNINDDVHAREAANTLRNTSGKYGDYYWNTEVHETYLEPIHTQIQSASNEKDRIFTLGQYRESDMRDVLSRIREHNNYHP